MTHTCKVCGVTGDGDKFYKSIHSKCKECHKKSVRENRANKADYYREYDAKRFQSDPKVKARHKRYQASRAGKERMRAARVKWMNKKPEARAAHVILGNAVRDGRIIKPLNCSECGKVEKSRKLHAHHDDYAKPLDVIWLCAQCHHDEHKGERSGTKV